MDSKFKKTSDIDLIVDFQDVDHYSYADNYFDLKDSLEKLFNREVDLSEDKAIKNPYMRQSIESSKQLIYGWNGQGDPFSILLNCPGNRLSHTKKGLNCISTT